MYRRLSPFRENTQSLSKNFVTLGLMELKSWVMPVRTRTEGMCRTLKNIYAQSMPGFVRLEYCSRSSNEHNHSSKSINRSWEFYELHPGQKQSNRRNTRKAFLGICNEMQGVDVCGYEESYHKWEDWKLILDTEVLFWRLLVVSMIRDIDMRKVLHNELVTIPPALFYALQ